VVVVFFQFFEEASERRFPEQTVDDPKQNEASE
jgi:hypothetical protein